MKAYMVFSGYPQDGCLLVYAETSNKAKSLCVGHDFDWEYTQMNSRRQPDYDQHFNGTNTIIECNDDLQKGVPPFFSDAGIEI